MSVRNKLPNHWRDAKFSDFVDSIVGGCSTQKSDYFREGVLVLNKGNIKTLGKIEFTKDRVYVKPKYAAQHPKKIIRNGDLVATFRDLSAKADFLGLIGIFKESEDALLTQGAYIVRLDQTVDPHFLVYYSNSPAYRGLMKKLKHGSTQVHIRNADFLGVPILLPPLPEQKKIAHILSTVQRSIEEQERIIQTTTELKKALMHKLFTEGLRNEPQKQTAAGLIPESWKVCKVGDVVRIQSGGTPSRDTPENWSGGTIPWVKTGEIDYCIIRDTEEKITPTGLSNSAARVFPAGTLLMAMYGQGITRGRVALLAIEAATNQACASITPTDEDEVSSRFLYYWFEYNYENLRKLGHGANQRNMNAALIRSFPLAVPSTVDQRGIVAALSELDAKGHLLMQKGSSLNNLFRNLLHELMTAKTRINSLEFPTLKPAKTP